MNRTPRLSAVLDSFWVALTLSALYPTIFALSNNWYAINPSKIAWLILAALVVGSIAYAVIEATFAALCSFASSSVANARGHWADSLRRLLLAAVCVTLLFGLFAGTLIVLISSGIARWIAFVAAVFGVWWLFRRGRQRYFNLALGLLTLLASASWLISLGRHYVSQVEAALIIDKQEPFEQVKFLERPNIYFFIYDAYGSDALYRKVFNFDNSEHYRLLNKRGFKVVHTFSNYWWTWATVIGVFLGNHNYYKLVDGISDTTEGRAFMAGLRHNPVFQTVRNNGYRIQQIHGSDYLVSERGNLDYLYPDEPMYGTVKIFGNSVLNRLIGQDPQQWKRSIDKQKQVIISRLPEPPDAGSGPWLTFSHVGLPSHGPTDKNWDDLEYFEQEFVDRTLLANQHMLSVMDAIAAKDPAAIVMIIGDHGAWRYRHVWWQDPNPNRSFAKTRVTSEMVTYDLFGVMIAVRSAGRCDDYLYPGVTPVNIMRVVFACLSRDRSLLQNRPDDVSIAWIHDLWETARDGQLLQEWQPYDAP